VTSQDEEKQKPKKAGATKGRRSVSGGWAVYTPEDRKVVSFHPEEIEALRLTEGALVRAVFVPWGANVEEVIQSHQGA